MELKILGSICFLEAVGTVGNIMGYHLGAGLLTVYTVYLGMEKTHKKICPECQCEIRKSYRICPECGHLFQEGLSEEQLTDVIEKEKEDDMSSEQIDRAFEKVDTLSMEEVKAYDSELDDFLRK